MLAIFSLAVLLLPFGATSDFVTALAIAVPSISIISVLVMQYNLLEKETGRIILSTVAITDIVAFVLLVAVSTPIFNTLSVIAYTVILVAAFIALDIVLNRQAEEVQEDDRKGWPPGQG